MFAKNAGALIRDEAGRLREKVRQKKMSPPEAVRHLQFTGDWQKRRLLSFRRFDPRIKITDKVDEIEEQVGLRERRLLARACGTADTSAHLSRKQKQARNIIVVRTRRGFPFSLARVPRARRREQPADVEQILNWADGKRDLLEILDLHRFDTGKGMDSRRISELIRYLRLLQEFGYVDLRYQITVGKADIKKGLRRLGVREGGRIMVHTSLTGLGYVRGGAKALCEALMELVTAEGVLMMSSFNHDRPFHEDAPGYYDPRETPATDGIVPDTFWRMRGVCRSLNPTHAFAVWGKDARDYVKNHHKVTTMGAGSPAGLLEQQAGKIVLIDCPGANSFHHVVEMTNSVHCLGKRTEEYSVRLPNHRTVKCRTWGWRRTLCPISEKGLYIPEMRRRGLMREGRVGNAHVSVFRMGDCRAVLEEFFKGKIKGCPGCAPCSIRPRTVEATVKSDWDDREGRVKDHTTAFMGNYWS